MNGHEIKAIRTRKGLTQQQFAEIVGVSSNTIARWEREELGISDVMISRLSEVAASIPSGTTVTRTSGVVLDPFHREILAALNGSLDPEVFEACAVELLQLDWPKLVPVRGGKDHGFDGAVADVDAGEPFPLVVTTSKKLVQNFKSNIDSAKANGWNPKRALFATSRRITPAMRKKLFDAARERKITLKQTYDQDWFAVRLYHNPHWCKRLLNVSGKPRSLSVFPVSRRPVLGDEVLGREQEKKWLLEQVGDCLLVGEPGSGKTFLLRALALEGKALFLVDEDREKIARDLCVLKPDAVIVDDAHVRPKSIEMLVHLRTEIQASFRIIASCWPGQEAGTKSEMQIGSSDVLTLNLVDADTMIEIIKSVGIRGPDELLYLIRKQAAGRPGLAITLAHLCIIGDVHGATSGEGLVDSIAPQLDQLLELKSMQLLAPFALGGDAGAQPKDVAHQLNMSLLDLSSSLATLGAAGIVKNTNDSSVLVEPTSMRWVLVRRVFFDTGSSLPVEQFLSIVQSREESLRTLIGARARGATIPNLERMIEDANSEALWADYALLGPDATRYALTRHPKNIKVLAQPGLEFLPDIAIRMLLFQMQEECNAGEALESLMHPLERWIKSGNALHKQVAIERRRTLLKCTKSWWRQSANSAVSIAVICFALKPDFDFLTQDPGVGRRLTFTMTKLDAEIIDQLSISWSDVKTVVDEGSDIPWIDLLELVAHWCHARLKADDDTQNAVVRFRSQLMNDLASASRRYPGVQHRISELANSVDAAVNTSLEPNFECMYPSQENGTKGCVQKFQSLEQEACRLAEHWTKSSASDLAKFLGDLESEARRAGITHPRLTPAFCRALAGGHSDPGVIARFFMDENLPADLVEPFLTKAISADSSAWSIVSDCLEHNLYIGIGSQLAFCHSSAPAAVVEAAMDIAQEVLPLVEHLCVREEISQRVLSRLFSSREASVAVTAALGHWQAFGDGGKKVPLYDSWCSAILRSTEVSLSPNDFYWIGEVLGKDGNLAVAWLVRLLDSDQTLLGYGVEEVVKKAVKSLDSDGRICILTSIRPSKWTFGVSEVVQALVGFDTVVYRCLLKSESLKKYHLSPLMAEPVGAWRNIASMALNHGYSCRELVDASLDGIRSWQGDESKMWQELRQHFENLQVNDDSNLTKVGELGASIVAQLEQRARQYERHEAIHGIS